MYLLGIDIFFGRWDTNAHKLADQGISAIGKDGLPSQIIPVSCTYMYMLHTNMHACNVAIDVDRLS